MGNAFGRTNYRYLRLKPYLTNVSHIGIDDDKRGLIFDPCRCGIHIFTDKKIDSTQCDKREKKPQTKKKSQPKLTNRFYVTDKKNKTFRSVTHITHITIYLPYIQSVGSKFNCILNTYA